MCENVTEKLHSRRFEVNCRNFCAEVGQLP
jgi:hypothetical protein